MAIDTTVLRRDLDNVIADLPTTVLFGSDTVSGSRTSLRRDYVMADEGLRDRYRFSVICDSGDFTTVPDTDDLVTISGAQYIVLSRRFDPADQAVTLDLGDKFSA